MSWVRDLDKFWQRLEPEVQSAVKEIAVDVLDGLVDQVRERAGEAPRKRPPRPRKRQAVVQPPGPLPDYYKVLGVRSTATAVELKHAYHQLALQTHPDRHPTPEAAARFPAIAEAYEVLSDPRRRAEFDAGRGAHA